VADLATFSRGAVLDSRYHLQRLLATGGMASVWLANDDALERAVAVKIIADTLACDDTWVRRFEREARTLAGLNHPNIVRIFDFGVDRGRPFLVMEYLGRTLARGVADGACPDLELIARHLLSALDHMHAAGLVHRDIKPSNVLLANDGSPRLTDFGIAYSQETTRLTSTGMVIGSARYLAPEVLAGEPATPRSDLFSLGRLLDELRSLRESPPRLVRLIRALTESDPARRPHSARDALDTLERPASRVRALQPRGADVLGAAAAHARERGTRLLARGRERATRIDARSPRARERAHRQRSTHLAPSARLRERALPPLASSFGASRRRLPVPSPRSRKQRVLAARLLAAIALLTVLVLGIASSPGGRAPAAPPARAAAAATGTSGSSSTAPARAPARAGTRQSLQQRLDAIARRISLAAGH